MTVDLHDMLKQDRIQCGVLAHDWKDVVYKTGALMEQAGLITPQYTEAMVTLIKEHGPYLVIAPGVALLHARPEDGVKKAGMALVTLSKPVEFGHSSNDPVWIVFGLAAIGDTSHIDAMAELATLLSAPGAIEDIRQCSTPEDMTEIIQRYSKEEG